MSSIPGKTWTLPSGCPELADQLRSWLLANGGLQDAEIRSPHELWRIRYSDATFTFYKSGKLFATGSNDGAVAEAHRHIDSLVGSRFVPPSRPFLVGFDETGKGEVLGHLVLVGVAFPKGLFPDLELTVGSADSKTRHTFEYWDEIYSRIAKYQHQGLRYHVENIPPWHVDRYNLNTLLDLTYQRMLLGFSRKLELKQSRMVLDDYGIGPSLRRYLRALEVGGAEVVTTSHADDIYLESRVASLISKRYQQRSLRYIAKASNYSFEGVPLGSGNAGDTATLKWLNTWHATGRPWPWFVRRSFKTVQSIDGSGRPTRKIKPPLNDHLLSPNYKRAFEQGENDVRQLSVVCSHCGTTAKSVRLVVKGDATIGLCAHCKAPLPELALTLRYYCGRVLPDANVIIGAWISKDLSRHERFFENFTILLHPVVARESDNRGGKKELQRLGEFSSLGRIRLENVDSLVDPVTVDNFGRDEVIRQAAVRENAILLTGDNGMKGAAQSLGLFVIEV